MWHRGDYRVIFRHEEFPDPEKIRAAMTKMWTQHQISDISTCEGHPIISDALINGIQFMSVVVLQKRIREGDLHAWANLGIGYSFCGPKDHFVKHRGRQCAFERALDQVQAPHREQFTILWGEKAGKACKRLFEGGK